MTQIAANSHVDPAAQVDGSVVVGPHCTVGPQVRIGPDCVLENNVTLTGRTTIGRGNRFFPNAVIGTEPQDLKYRGGTTKLLIGDQNVFRENCTVNTGTELGGGVTRIGNGNLLMIGAHVAHDCVLEDHLIVANNVMMAGHCKLQSYAAIMGGAAMHHFITIGRHAYVAGFSRVVHDVPPFLKISGDDPCSVRGVNIEGLKRTGFSDAQIDALKQAHRALYRSGSVLSANIAALLADQRVDGLARELAEFLQRSTTGVNGRHLERLRADK